MTARLQWTFRMVMTSALVAVLTLCASEASAALIVILDNPSTLATEATLTDGDLDGMITFGPAVGAFTLNVGGAFSKPTLGTATSPRLDLSSFDLSTSAGTLVIRVTDTGFTSGPSSMFMSIGGTTDGTVSYEAYWDPSNAAFGMAHQIGSTLSFGPGGTSYPFSGSSLAGDVGSVAPFSLTQVITITHATGGRFPKATSFDAGLVAVPEPGATVLLGLGIAAMGIASRCRRPADRA